MIGKTLIIAGGDVNIPFITCYLEDKQFDTIVCADSGLDVAYQLGLSVQYAMGDFDSASKESITKYNDSGTEFIRYPVEKDATDTHIVLDWVVDKLPSEIILLGATGKRLDHFLANVNVLMKPLSYGIPTYIVDEHNCLYLLDRSYVFHREKMHGKYISFLPFTEEVSAVYLRGFKYELDGQTLTLGNSIGVSNELSEESDTALIEFGEGVMIAIESRD